MANWCYNYVEFTSTNQEKLNELYSLLSEFEIKQSCNLGEYLLEGDQKPVYDLFSPVDTGVSIIVSYLTKWSPNLRDLQKLATKFECNFNVEYKETGHEIFGKASFENGELLVQDLSNDDFEEYSFDEDTDCYMFEGEEYECEDDILETLWKRKYNFI